jgi:hypothetical protein
MELLIRKQVIVAGGDRQRIGTCSGRGIFTECMGFTGSAECARSFAQDTVTYQFVIAGDVATKLAEHCAEMAA